MKHPFVFNEFALYCMRVDDEDPGDISALEAIVRKSYLRLTEEERRELKAYLDGLLEDGAYTDIELRDIWWGSGARIIFFSGIRGFLKDVQIMLEQDLFAPQKR